MERSARFRCLLRGVCLLQSESLVVVWRATRVASCWLRPRGMLHAVLYLRAEYPALSRRQAREDRRQNDRRADSRAAHASAGTSLPRCLGHASPPFPIAPATPTAPAPTRSPCATLHCAVDIIDAINGAQCSTAQRHAPASSLPMELVGPVPARSSRTHCAFHAAAITVAGRAGGSYENG